MKVVVAGTVIMVLTLSSVLWGKGVGVSKSSLQFDATKAAHIRCRISPSNLGGWNLKVVAQDSKGHQIFGYLYSVRKHIKTSMQDCTAWMKAVKEQRKSSSSQHAAHFNRTDPPKTKP